MYRVIFPVSFMVILCLGSGLVGCSSRTLKPFPPYVKTEPIDTLISGPLSYNGNRDYLPKTINESSIGPLISYEIKVEYSTTEPMGDFFRALIPTTVIGTAIGSSGLLCGGTVTVACVNGTRLMYSAASSIRKSTNIFEGSDLSSLRREGLLSVRDNLETQMSNDVGSLNKCMYNGE